MRDYDIESDLKQEKFQNIKLVQGDKGNKIKINVFEDGQPVSLAGCSITAKYKRSDGEVVDGTVENITDNYFYAVMDSDITKTSGVLKMLFAIEKDDVKVSTFMLLADVREGIGESTGSSGGSTGGGEVTVDLSNYYKKNETYSKSQIDAQFKDIAKQIENVGSPTDEQVTTAINQAIKDGKISTLDSTTKKALMDIVENIGLWADGNGQKYIDNLKNALYTSPLSSISAIYTQNKTIYVDDDLDVLKEDLVVTGIYTDGSSINITDYTLSGTLSVGTSTITVLKDGKTTTFEVIVTATRIPATNINLDKTKISFLNNTPIQITATVEPSNSTDNITWSSSEENVAKVKNGLVTPVSDGSCIIYAKAGDVTVECSINVSFPLSGFNMGNPYLTKVDTLPESGKTEKELQNKWYKASYNSWANALGITDSRWVYMHPFGEGTYYIRVLSDSRSTPYRMYAFGNSDIGTNPTTTLGIVGTSYKDAYFTELTTFDWVDYEGNQKSGNVNLGEYKYVDGSEQSFGECWVRVIKLTVPANTYVFLTANMYTAKITPGISNNYSLNDLYTIFESDPSANILQIVK